MSSTSASIQLQFVNRLGNLPLVHSVLDVANQSYNKLKSSNKLVTATLDQAEKSFQLLSTGAITPVLNRFEQSIKYADNMACTGLDKLQQTVPVINQSPDEIKSSTQKYYDQTKDRLVNAKQQTMDKVHSALNLSDSLVKSLDTTLNAAEAVLEYLLPRQTTEQDEAGKLNGNVAGPSSTDNPNQSGLLKMIARMTSLSDKIRRRVVDYTRYKWLPAIFGTVLFKKSSSVLSQTQTILQNGKLHLTNNGSDLKKSSNNSKKPKQQQQQQQQPQPIELEPMQANGE